MAESYVPQNNEGAALVGVSRTQRLWVLGLLLSAVAAVALGLGLAAGTDGVAKPWTGTAFVVAIGLALVVGASKTSSA
ncbi:MAG: hypothetical protein ACJ78Q_03880 [Chloroflexia bacterium]